MNEEDKSLIALEDELRAQAACDRKGAEEAAAALASRVQDIVAAECGRQRRSYRLYRSAAASVALLGVAGAFLLWQNLAENQVAAVAVAESCDEWHAPMPAAATETDEGAVETGSEALAYNGPVEVCGKCIAPQSLTAAPCTMPESAVAVAATGAAPAEERHAVPFRHAKAAKRATRGEVKTTTAAAAVPAVELLHVLAHEPQPYINLKRCFEQPCAAAAVQLQPQLRVEYSNGCIRVLFGKQVYTLQSEQDTLPAELRHHCGLPQH